MDQNNNNNNPPSQPPININGTPLFPSPPPTSSVFASTDVIKAQAEAEQHLKTTIKLLVDAGVSAKTIAALIDESTAKEIDLVRIRNKGVKDTVALVNKLNPYNNMSMPQMMNLPLKDIPGKLENIVKSFGALGAELIAFETVIKLITFGVGKYADTTKNMESSIIQSGAFAIDPEKALQFSDADITAVTAARSHMLYMGLNEEKRNAVLSTASGTTPGQFGQQAQAALATGATAFGRSYGLDPAKATEFFSQLIRTGKAMPAVADEFKNLRSKLLDIPTTDFINSMVIMEENSRFTGMSIKEMGQAMINNKENLKTGAMKPSDFAKMQSGAANLPLNEVALLTTLAENHNIALPGVKKGMTLMEKGSALMDPSNFSSLYTKGGPWEQVMKIVGTQFGGGAMGRSMAINMFPHLKGNAPEGELQQTIYGRKIDNVKPFDVEAFLHSFKQQIEAVKEITRREDNLYDREFGRHVERFGFHVGKMEAKHNDTSVLTNPRRHLFDAMESAREAKEDVH